jgi:hypothetical protein
MYAPRIGRTTVPLPAVVAVAAAMKVKQTVVRAIVIHNQHIVVKNNGPTLLEFRGG